MAPQLDDMAEQDRTPLGRLRCPLATAGHCAECRIGPYLGQDPAHGPGRRRRPLDRRRAQPARVHLGLRRGWLAPAGHRAARHRAHPGDDRADAPADRGAITPTRPTGTCTSTCAPTLSTGPCPANCWTRCARPRTPTTWRSSATRATSRCGRRPSPGSPCGRPRGDRPPLSLISARIRQSRVRGLFGQPSHATPGRRATQAGRHAWLIAGAGPAADT